MCWVTLATGLLLWYDNCSSTLSVYSIGPYFMYCTHDYVSLAIGRVFLSSSQSSHHGLLYIATQVLLYSLAFYSQDIQLSVACVLLRLVGDLWDYYSAIGTPWWPQDSLVFIILRTLLRLSVYVEPFSLTVCLACSVSLYSEGSSPEKTCRNCMIEPRGDWLYCICARERVDHSRHLCPT